MQAIGFAASRLTATSSDLSQYQIVHLATHGLLNTEKPELSGLVLSLFNQEGEEKDGFLRLHDIYNLNLPAELVVLSACETGLGQEIKGEGLVGLTRGFMYAGAKGIAVSLWSVNDAGTAKLMEKYYQKMLNEGLTSVAAMRAAQLEMWQSQQWNSPYYWSAFVVQGEWR
ncbi:MAG: CHAT domain-containing protein [Coleofasciculaceae cyanobacterium]